MRISTKGRYALRLMLDLAEHQGDGCVSLKDVAQRQDISKKYLEQIVPTLSRAGFLLTNRGYQGGYRLARRTYHLKEPTGRTMQFVVPAAALKEVEKILGEEDTVTFTLGPKHILFEMGNATLICRLLEGDFLDWRRVVPTDCPVKLTANVDDLAVTIDRVGLIVTEKLKSPVRCLFGDNVATFRTTTAIGAAEDQCAIAGNGEELEIGFNCRYLADALRAIPSQEVCLELKNGLSPIVFTPVREEDDFAYMVLPVRLRAN